MDSLAFWQNYWYFLGFGLFMIYTLLDGFDMGVGIILPFYGKSPEMKARLIGSIAPFWDGNGVWLVIAFGSLFAVFPQAYIVILSGLYIPVLFLVFSFVLRALALGFWYHEHEGKALWENLLTVSSFIATLLTFYVLGALLQGVPLSADKQFAGSILSLVRPLPILMAVSGILLVVLQGLNYGALKLDGELRENLRQKSKLTAWFVFASLIILFIVLFSSIPNSVQRPFVIAGAIAILGLTGLSGLYSAKFGDKTLVSLSSGAIVALWVVISGVLYPDVVRASNDPSLSISMINGSAPLSSLKSFGLFSIPVLFIIAVYTTFVYRVFKGKFKD